jgi:hypothetical protein
MEVYNRRGYVQNHHNKLKELKICAYEDEEDINLRLERVVEYVMTLGRYTTAKQCSPKVFFSETIDRCV